LSTLAPLSVSAPTVSVPGLVPAATFPPLLTITAPAIVPVPPRVPPSTMIAPPKSP
jgi:hypothetical protein